MSFLNRYHHKAFFFVSALYWIFAMHFTLPNLGGSGLYLPSNVIGWMYFSLMVSLLLWYAIREKNLIASPLMMSIFFGVAILCVPLLYKGFTLKFYALPRILGLVAGALYLLSLYQWQSKYKNRDVLLYIILGGVAIEGVFGLVQYYYIIPNFDFINRPHGIFQQPNVMASFMATGLAIAIWLELRHQNNLILSIFRYFVIVTSTILLVVLQSRTGQVGGVLALLLVFPMLYRDGRLKIILPMVFIGVAIGFVSIFSFGGTRGLDIYQTGGIRSVYWSYIIKLIMQSPLVGWGYGGFESTFLHEYMSDRFINPTMPMIEKGLKHPHNEFLLWAMEGGAIAIIGMLVIILSVINRLYSTKLLNGMALLSLITPILIHTQTEYPFYHAVSHWWLLLSLVYIIDKEVSLLDGDALEHRSSLPTYKLNTITRLIIKVVALSTPLLVIPFMITTLHANLILVKFRDGNYQNPSILDEVVNPIGLSTQVQFDRNTVRLIEALKTNDRTGLSSYIEWGGEVLRHSPHVKLYSNMIIASIALNEVDQAMKLKREAEILFPNEPQFSK